MRKTGGMISKLFCLLWLVALSAVPVIADTGLSPAEMRICASALEDSNHYERRHIVLVWPKKLQVNWYPESQVQSPEQLAD